MNWQTKKIENNKKLRLLSMKGSSFEILKITYSVCNCKILNFLRNHPKIYYFRYFGLSFHFLISTNQLSSFVFVFKKILSFP